MLRMLLRFPKGIFDGAHHNAHRIPVYTDEAKKKINPIKASKRGLRG